VKKYQIVEVTPSGIVRVYREAARDANTVVGLVEGTRSDCLVAALKSCGHVSETWQSGLTPAGQLADAAKYADAPCYYCNKIAHRSDVEWSYRQIVRYSGPREWDTIDAFVDARMTGALETPYGKPVPPVSEAAAVRAMRRLATRMIGQEGQVQDDLAAYGAPSECYADVADAEARRVLRLVKRVGIDPNRLLSVLEDQITTEGATMNGYDTPLAFHQSQYLYEALRRAGAVRE
jgi:hypothetical protein